MTDRPYTDDDLRAEAARQLSAHSPNATVEQVYAALLDARIDNADADGPTWSEALDVPELADPAGAVHALIAGAADTFEWAVNLGADGLAPYDGHLTLDGDDKPFARIHFAFDPGMPEEMRIALVQGVGGAIARHL